MLKAHASNLASVLNSKKKKKKSEKIIYLIRARISRELYAPVLRIVEWPVLFEHPFKW